MDVALSGGNTVGRRSGSRLVVGTVELASSDPEPGYDVKEFPMSSRRYNHDDAGCMQTSA